MNRGEELALFGGKPARANKFAGPVIIGKEERKEVNAVLNDRSLSRFMGSASGDIEKQLVMKSREAISYNSQYFMFLGGKKVRRFEADFSRFLKGNYAISVNSATSGLISALGACGVGPGDEVLTTCLSFNATAMSIPVFNAIPVFCDISRETLCIDPLEIEKKLTRRTKAIIVVHLLGKAADMDAIMRIARKNGIKVIEDCAQALGVKIKNKYVGTIGDIGVFSFQETKNMTTGEGGMIVTNDPVLAKKCRLIRNHGESIPDNSTPEPDLVNMIGFNFRMTELTAAIGIAQLKRLLRNNLIRNVNANFLRKELKGLPGLTMGYVRPGYVCHVFDMTYDSDKTGVSRDVVIKALRSEGIPVGTGYLRLMPENPIFTKQIAYGKQGCPFTCHYYEGKVKYDKKDYPVAADLIYNGFIWFYHINRPNTMQDMQDVVKAFKKVFNGLDKLKIYKLVNEQKVYKW